MRKVTLKLGATAIFRVAKFIKRGQPNLSLEYVLSMLEYIGNSKFL